MVKFLEFLVSLSLNLLTFYLVASLTRLILSFSFGIELPISTIVILLITAMSIMTIIGDVLRSIFGEEDE